jgi:hypothetical protein
MLVYDAAASQTNADVLSLSVVMPAHNEERTIFDAVSAVLSLDVSWPIELIVVDDGSTDATSIELARHDDPRLTVLHHEEKRGKGAAVLTAASRAVGSHLVIYDADLEYAASDLVMMFEEIRAGRADVVFGSRNFADQTEHGPWYYTLGRHLMTGVANALFRSSLTDLHTCLKMVPVSLFRDLTLTERGFGLDSEITAELLRRGCDPAEVPVSYCGRSREEGKKITWRDGVACRFLLNKVSQRRQRRAAGERAAGPVPLGEGRLIIDLLVE